MGVRYRHEGRPRKYTIGTYPAIGLATARELARDALEKVARGTDPAAVKAKASVNSFVAVAELFIDRHCRQHQRE